MFQVICYDWPREAVVWCRLSPVTHLDSILSPSWAVFQPPCFFQFHVTRLASVQAPSSPFSPSLVASHSLVPQCLCCWLCLFLLSHWLPVACGLLAAQSRNARLQSPVLQGVHLWCWSMELFLQLLLFFLPHIFLMTQIQIIFEDHKVPCGLSASASSLYSSNGVCDCRIWQKWQN